MIAALVLFAALALAVVDRAQHRAVDAQLQSIARALRFVGDVHHGRLSVDAKDRTQFDTIVGAQASSAIVAPDGSVVVSTEARPGRVPAALALGANASTSATVALDGRRLRVFAEPIVEDGVRVGATLAWRDIEVIDALDRTVAIAFAVAIPLIAALAIVAGGEIARRGLAPVNRIATLASEIEAQDLSRRLSLPDRNDELGRLAATFDRMLDRLQSAFDRERRFTSDASHELRAPLSVIRAEADLALRHERTPAEYRRALATIAAEADALEALTRDLLAAARNGSAGEDVRAPVDLGAVAAAVVTRMNVLAGVRGVKVDGVDGVAGGRVIVNGDRALIERAVLSVVHNAIKYAPEAGRVEVRVSGSAPRAEVTVTDDGPGFSEAALARGFDRFWRDDEARSREGTGLGLSIAKAIVERYGGTIALTNARPHGAIVQMTFLLDS